MTDTPNATPEAADAADMEDILSSIKNTVEEETAKAEEGVLTLDAADMMDPEEGSEVPAQIEERIDLDAFTESGDVNTEEVDINKADILDDVVGVAANPPKPDIPEAEGDPEVENADEPIKEEPEPAADEDAGEVDIDAMMAAAAPEEPAKEEASDEVDVDAMLAEAAEPTPEESDDSAPTEEPAADEDTGEVDIDAITAEANSSPEVKEETPKEEAVEPEAPTDASDVDVDALMSEASAEEVASEPAEAEASVTPEVEVEESLPSESENAVASTPAEPIRSIDLPATATAGGLQVGFPAEILAEALRPLVKGWVDENLQGIVEKLVKEELERLASE